LKLDHREFGPYEVLEKIGEKAYKLKFPSSMRIHNVFNVDLLEPKKPDLFNRDPVALPPIITPEGEEEYEVEEILDTKLNRGRIQYLVKWKGYDASENKWIKRAEAENIQTLINEFHEKNPTAIKDTYVQRKPLPKRKVLKATLEAINRIEKENEESKNSNEPARSRGSQPEPQVPLRGGLRSRNRINYKET